MRVSDHGHKVITAIGEGRRFTRASDGWRATGLRAPISLVEELERADLVCRRDDMLCLTTLGARYAKPKAAAERPTRLLAERPLREARSTGAPPARSVTTNLLESPLGWLRARGLIDPRQFDAGERLRGDWTMAGLGPRVTMRWDPTPAGGRRGPDAPLDPTLAGIAAKRRFDGAIDAAGKGLSDVLWRVVCAGEGLEAAETALAWPKRSGKLVLLMALDRVADYYGIA